MTMLFASGLQFGNEWGIYFLFFLIALVFVLLKEHWKQYISGGLFILLSIMVMGLSGNEPEVYRKEFTSLKTVAGLGFIALMFYIYEYCGHSFLASGVAERIAEMRFLRRNFTRRLAWITFVSSAFIDNVAAAKMAKKIAQKKYGRKTIPSDATAAIICASNAGGAWSPIGDTTTIMIVTKVLVAIGKVHVIFFAIPACIVYQLIINSFLPKEEPDDTPVAAAEKTPIYWSRLLPLLAIPGLVTAIIVMMVLPQDGSILYDFLPMIGLLGGFALGVTLATVLTAMGRGTFGMEWHVFKAKSLAVNTLFIVLLLGCAHMLPIKNLVEFIVVTLPGWFMPDGFSYALGYLSSYFDNIPLTESAILMGGLVWHRLAFLVGVGGSMTWSGSSAGVNVTMPEKEEDSPEGERAHPDHPHLYEAGDADTEAHAEQDPARDIRVWFGNKGYWHFKGWAAMTAGIAVDLVLFWALGMRF